MGATSLEDFLNRLETVDRVSQQDARVLEQVQTFRTGVQQRKAELAKARANQARIVAEQAARKQAIQGQLAERQRLLTSIRGEIEEIMAAERRRALAAAAQTRARHAGEPAGLRARRRVPGGRGGGSDRGGAALALRRRGRDRDAVPRRPVQVGRRLAVRLRLLRLRDVRLRAGRRLAAALHAARSGARACPCRAATCSPATSSSSTASATPGIYVGGGSFIHAPHTGDVVKVSSLGAGWYASTYMGARRIL